MFFSTKIVAASALAAIASALTISSPASLIVCQPAALTFSGGAGAPYYISVLPGGQPSAAALENLPTAQSSPVTWTVDLAAGTNVSLKITDKDGTIAYSGAVVIQSGSSTSCIGTNAAASSGATSGTAAATGSTTRASSTSGSATSAAASASTTSARSAGNINAQSAGSMIAIFGLLATALGVVA